MKTFMNGTQSPASHCVRVMTKAKLEKIRLKRKRSFLRKYSGKKKGMIRRLLGI